jgi:hypothetical protein
MLFLVNFFKFTAFSNLLSPHFKLNTIFNLRDHLQPMHSNLEILAPSLIAGEWIGLE